MSRGMDGIHFEQSDREDFRADYGDGSEPEREMDDREQADAPEEDAPEDLETLERTRDMIMNDIEVLDEKIEKLERHRYELEEDLLDVEEQIASLEGTG